MKFLVIVWAAVKALFKPRFKDLPYARKECTKCGAVFSQYQMSMGDSHHFYGPVWYELCGGFKAAPGCECAKILGRNKPKY